MSLKRCKLNYSREFQFNLADKLNKVCKSLDKTFAINSGGCCYIAYCIAKLLEKDNFKFSLIVFDDNHDLHKYVELSDLPEPMMHYAILIESENGDGDAINCEDDDFDFSYQDFKVTSEDIIDYYLRNDWNHAYNCLYNGFIKQIIERVYYEYTESLRER